MADPRDRRRGRAGDWMLGRRQTKEEFQAVRRALRAAKTEYRREYKAERGCALCGEPDPVCLDFHHRDPTTKTPKLKAKPGRSRNWNNLSWAEIDAEIAKCIVLCSNCHRKEEARLASS